MAVDNPFEYEAAKNLPYEMIFEYFIEDHSFSRFIRSNRNVFLVGERGSGKSMNLLYQSVPIQLLKANQSNDVFDLKYIGIYIPCNTPLFHKQDYLLLPDAYKANIASENLFVLNIAYYIVDALDKLRDRFCLDDSQSLVAELQYILNKEIPSVGGFFNCLKVFFQGESTRFQTKFNAMDTSQICEEAWTFSSLIIPLLSVLRKIETLSNSHFMLLIDDAHDLNSFQRKLLNSLISFRDHTVFSFKVATAKATKMDFTTSSGGSILEGHDFILIDLEQPFQNKFSPYGKLAKDIIERRLKNIGLTDVTAEQFFPINKELASDLEGYATVARSEAEKLFPVGDAKKITDFVYKYSRVNYFRARSSKANRPPYSGFELLTHTSTGVIRNLLDPCYWMFDRVLSNIPHESRDKAVIRCIPSKVQTEIIIERSERLWGNLRNGIDSYVQNCTADQARSIYNLFDQLAILFKKRLMTHKTEPRAIVFSISGLTAEYENDIMPLLNIARRANLLYVRTGPAKDDGKLESYFVPNRLLWPSRGLDPQGQHARVSLKAADLCAAARGVPFPYDEKSGQDDTIQGSLF